MKYKDIKKDALRLMGVIPDTVENEYDTSNIRAYILGMNNSIMRAIDRMKSLSLIPPKTLELPKVKKNNYYYFWISELKISKNILRIVKIESLKLVEVDYIILNNKISVYLEKDESYMIEYLPEFNSNFDDSDEIEVPDELARLIPYFIKADLYEEEEPALSASARNMFEGYLSEYIIGRDITQRTVKAVHKL